MDNFWGIIPIILIVGLIVIFIFKSRKQVLSRDRGDTDSTTLISITSQTFGKENVKNSRIPISLGLLATTTEIDEKSLFEIINLTVIARISAISPIITEIATRTVSNNTLKNMEVYRLIIPSGETLAKSLDMKGAWRGFFHGAKGIKGHGNWVKVDASKATSLANGFANVMNIGSLVVGQYYMCVINSKLETITKNIDKISDFQNREFKSRILHVITFIGEISKFSSEIMESDDQRKLKLITLANLMTSAAQLLGQVNFTIDDIVKKSPNPDYKEYQERVNDFNILVEYQIVLVDVLAEISKLTYLLGKETISIESSYSTFYIYRGFSEQTRNALEEWHKKQVRDLNIDLDNNRILKSGVEGIISAMPALIDDEWKYKTLQHGLVQKIKIQSQTELKAFDKSDAVYDKDVQIIIKDGKYYFLHEAPVVVGL